MHVDALLETYHPDHDTTTRRAFIEALPRLACLTSVAATTASCSLAIRKIAPAYGQFTAKLHDIDVRVFHFANIKRVQQEKPELCWAAALEQVLALQDVNISQQQILRSVFDTDKASAIGITSWLRAISDLRLKLSNSDPVWIKTEAYVLRKRFGRNEFADFLWMSVPVPGLAMSTPPFGMLNHESFFDEAAQEVAHNRIPVLGVETRKGERHIVTLVGIAFTRTGTRFTPEEVVGFMIYDPWTATSSLATIHDLAKVAVVVFLVATTRYLSAFPLAFEPSQPFSKEMLSAHLDDAPALTSNAIFDE